MEFPRDDARQAQAHLDNLIASRAGGFAAPPKRKAMTDFLGPTAAEIAKTRRGISTGSGYLIPCPCSSHGRGRGDLNPSLHIRDGDRRLWPPASRNPIGLGSLRGIGAAIAA
jgi:hypothetical protein